jgi:cytoskeletal protein RodZ
MSDFGGKLRLARERRGISLRQIAASTKISIAVLEALERNDISKLPGGIFSRGFVRSYAIEVGLDPDATVHEFLEKFQAAPVTPIGDAPAVPEEESTFETQQRIARVVTLLVAISVPLIGLVLYFTLRPQRSVEAPQPSASAESSPPPPPVSNGQSGSAPPVGTAATSATAGAPKRGPMKLELHPTGDCWIKLTVDGETVVSRLMHAGEKEVREVRDAAVIEVGNAGAFAYSVDGRPGRPLGALGQVRTARISRDTLAQYVQ